MINKTRLEILCRRRDALWDKIIDGRQNDEDVTIINLYKEELEECERDIHKLLYEEVKEERKRDKWINE